MNMNWNTRTHIQKAQNTHCESQNTVFQSILLLILFFAIFFFNVKIMKLTLFKDACMTRTTVTVGPL